MSSNIELTTKIASLLRAKQIKITKPRIKILEVFLSNKDLHFSADDVYKILIKNNNDKIGLATVYRVLLNFEELGILKKHNFGGNIAIFELAENFYHTHDHIIDLDTGDIKEFVDYEINVLKQKIAAKFGYKLIDSSFVLYVRKAN